MMKRFILIGVLFCTVIFNVVYAKGKQVEDIVLKEQIRDFLVEKEMNVVKSIGDHLNLFGLERIIDQKNYKDYEIYQASIDVGLIYRFTILKKNDNLYLMPRDFNKLLIDSNNLATKENELAIAEKYVELCRIDETIIEQSEIKKVSINTYAVENKENFYTTTYNVQIISWTKVNGVRIKWNFTFKDGQIHRYAILILDRFTGDYFFDEELPRPSKGSSGSSTFDIIQRTQERTELVTIKNHSDEEITFSDVEHPNDDFKYKHEYVVVKDDGNPKPPNERTVIIELSDFTPLSNVDVIITIKKDAAIDTLFNQAIPVDASGNANHNWEIPADVHTGKCKITANGGNEKYFFIYRTRSNALPGELNYNYHILYGDQFAGFNESVIETFADNVTTSIDTVYNEEINNWNFPSPEDIDLNDSLDIYVADYENGSAIRSTSGDSLIFKGIAIGYPYIDYLKNNFHYTTDLDAIGKVLCHEFLHSVQYHYPNIFINWVSPPNKYYKYISEGQARFIQTVYMDYHSSTAVNEEFAGGRQYQYQANQYLLNGLNLSLEDVDYDFCLFWRFLYENYQSGSESDKLDILIKLLEKSDIVGSDPIVDGEIAFDNALSSGGGLYSSFDDALKDFSKNCYLNDPTYNIWNPCPSDTFYVTPYITASHRDGITNTFTGERNITESDDIAEPFGIDYMVFNIGALVTNVCLSFDGDPDDNGNMADFYANALLMEGNDLISEQEISLTNGEGVISFEVNDPVNKVVLIIARLDSDETSENDYEVTLSDDEIHVSGNVSGTWSNIYSTYFIDGEITVPLGDTLIIEPGIKVNFSGHYKFNIYGRLLAEGTEDAIIIFTAQDTTTGWNGLRFYDQNSSGQDSSRVIHCILQHGHASGSFPDNCGGAIYLRNSDPFIDNCIISNNSAAGGGGFFLHNSSSPVITNTIIRNNSATENGGAIHIWNQYYNMCYPDFEYLIIVNNSAIYNGGGLYCKSWCFPDLTNCIFFGNNANYGGAIYCQYFYQYQSQPNLLNCILWNNTTSPIVAYEIFVNYSDIEGGGFRDEGNIDSDPLFVDAANNDFNLLWNSPCIDAGDPNYIDPDGTIRDMGTFSFYQTAELEIPSNIIFFVDSDSVHLGWDLVSGAIFYNVYSSENPDTGFIENENGIFDALSWSAPISTDNEYYYVKARNNRTSRAKNFIKDSFKSKIYPQRLLSKQTGS